MPRNDPFTLTAHSKTDQRTASALKLLELLSSAPGGSMSADAVATALGCSAKEVNRAVDAIDALGDRLSGARAIIYRDGSDIVLKGEASQLRPLRLSTTDAAALSHVLTTLHINDDARERIAEALLPDAMRQAPDRIATTVSYGEWYQSLQEAITDGVRCRITYRAHGDAAPAARIVDPIDIESTSRAAYLIAWNVEKGAFRRYSLERISAVELTDDSVEVHPGEQETLAESLSSATLVALRVADTLDDPIWAGIQTAPDTQERRDATRNKARDEAGSHLIRVHVASPAWLFDQVLAAGGAIRIVEPRETVQAFRAYAARLLDA